METNPYARIRNKRPEAAVKFLPTLPETRAKPSWLQAKPAFKELSPVRPGTQVSTLDTGYKNLYYTGFKTCYTGYKNIFYSHDFIQARKFGFVSFLDSMKFGTPHKYNKNYHFRHTKFMR